MCFKQSVISLLVTAFFLAVSARSLQDDKTNFNLLNLMSRSIDLMQRDSSHSSECFNYYIPLINETTATYQKNHQACLQASSNNRSNAEAATLDKQTALAASASSSCKLLSECSEISSAEKVFECYAAGGTKNVKTMYAINVNASEYLSDLQEDFHLIEIKEYKCTNETKRQYEKDFNKAYEDFNKCIAGIIDVPKPTEAPVEPSTTEKPATTESTANPEETTQAPVEPETSTEPVTSESTANPEESEKNLSKMPEEDLSFRR